MLHASKIHFGFVTFEPKPKSLRPLLKIKQEFEREISKLYPREEVLSLWRLVAEEATGLPRARILGLTSVEDTVVEKIESLRDRLSTGEPWQYIVGKAHFRDLELKVAPGVLIPRPETEELVDLALSRIGTKQDANILEVGTGSGCIAISLAKSLKRAKVHSMDISESAIEIARANIQEHSVNVNLINDDFLRSPQWDIPLDMIISNPPYIRESERSGMAKNVLEFEPENALFPAGDDPLIFYRAIHSFSNDHLKRGGSVVLELNASLAGESRDIFNGDHYTEIRNDLYGKPRFLLAVKEN